MLNIFGCTIFVLIDIVQIFLNMWLNPKIADQYSHGYSHIENYFDSYANEKTLKATMNNNEESFLDKYWFGYYEILRHYR